MSSRGRFVPPWWEEVNGFMRKVRRRLVSHRHTPLLSEMVWGPHAQYRPLSANGRQAITSCGCSHCWGHHHQGSRNDHQWLLTLLE